MTPGHRLRLLRTALNISQRDLAERSGYPSPTLSNIETEKHEPRDATAADIAKALGVKQEALADDAECLREIARVLGVSLGSLAGIVPENDALLAAARELAPQLGPARSAHVATMLRGLVGTILPQPPSPPVEEAARDAPQPGPSRVQPVTDEGGK